MSDVDRRLSQYEPRQPLTGALIALSVPIALLSIPMLGGKFLAGPWSDQYASGFGLRAWGAEQWRILGHIPLWNPEIDGGLPFVGALHGDIFYPTAWMRLVLPTATAINLGFVVHYVLAGLFLYVLLRLLRVSWAGSVTAGLAYQLSGVIGSYAAPGHDGKLFVTALLPLALIGLVLAFKRRRPEGHAVLAIAVGLGVLSPHPQMLYYMLVASGLFALYLAFGDKNAPPVRVAIGNLAGALGAVILGFGIGALQIVPFFDYLPYSPRADTYRGFAAATSYGIPWSHVPEFFLAGFTGMSQKGTYWASNPIKLHSEYLGLPVLGLALLGMGNPGRRRTVYWLGAIGFLFLLVALGAATPFYRVWYEVMPFMKKVRAPGMALYIVALVVAMFAGFGVERLERREGKGHALVWMVIGGLAALAGAAGVFGELARFFAEGMGPIATRSLQILHNAGPAIRLGSAISGLALALLGVAAFAWHRGRLPVFGFAVVVFLVVSGDLWRNAHSFWAWSEPRKELFAGDSLIDVLHSSELPYRVFQFPQGPVYPGASLMAYDVPELLMHHGNELHRFIELMGGVDRWIYATSRNLWELYGVRYVIVPHGALGNQTIPGFVLAENGVRTAGGVSADLLEREGVARYARVVPAAVKVADEQAIPVIVNPAGGFDPERIVLLAQDAPVEPAPVSTLPEPLQVSADFQMWEPGHMRIRLNPPPASDAYLVVAENWYPKWEVTVDGAPATALRGNVAMLTVAVPAGSQEIELVYRSAAYARGKAITFVSLVLALAGLVIPVFLRRRKTLG